MAPHPSRDGPPNSRVENPPIVSRPSSQPPPSGDSYKEREMGNRASVTNFGRPSSFNERQAYPDAMHDRMREGEFPSDRRVREMQREVDRDRPNGSSGPSSSPTHQQTTPFGTRERDRDAGNQRTWDISPEHGSHTGRPLYPHTSASLAANNMYSASSPNYPPYSHNTPGGDAQMATRDGPRQLGQFQNFEGSTQPIRGSISSPFDGLRGPRPYNSSQQPMPASGNQLFATGSGTPDHLQQRRVNNESPQPNARGLLGIYNEINRKGRLSPLPQAVQGAQGQISGPAGEPGIKSEFGRMFSGIGSGVGSGMSTSSPVGNGPPLGPNMSRREDGVDSPVFEGCIDGGEKFPRTSSRGGRRSKIMADDARNDSESGDGRLSPSGVVSRGAKRARHRHHHHAQPEDDVASPQPLPLPYPGLNNLKRTSTPLQNQLVSGGHHHHHHHHHAHRSTPPTITPAPIPFRKLVKTINSQDVLDQVSHLPRHHLGSAVYSQKISASVNRHSKNGFVYTPIPLPRLEGKENCTFTMRVPRNFLTPAMREQVVLRRALWGCDIYTDDSDVLAACIHSGWIRGEWPDNIDISLLDLATKDSVHPKNKPMQSSPLKGSSPFQMVMTSPPSAGPVVPPANMDLHVTLLVLPTLQKYTSTISHGIRSRSWAGNHDGMSYKILKLSWITEGTTPVEGRSGEDRRKRMRSMMTWKGGMGGSGVSISLNSKPKGGDPKCGNPKSDEPMSGDPKINGLKIKDPENGDLENEGPKNGDLENGDPMDEDPKTGDPMDEDPKDKDLKSCDPKSDYLKNKDPKNGDFENGDPMNEDSKIEDSKSEDPKNEDPKDDDLENADAELQPLAAI
ncbi:MAG: hypothetical protein M1829_006251 [Trizodia sp. TS-e1964]|nr:MAG: hypothetical protein M1829_006251 [Trizodia sp. TS-e1964]